MAWIQASLPFSKTKPHFRNTIPCWKVIFITFVTFYRTAKVRKRFNFLKITFAKGCQRTPVVRSLWSQSSGINGLHDRWFRNCYPHSKDYSFNCISLFFLNQATKRLSFHGNRQCQGILSRLLYHNFYQSKFLMIISKCRIHDVLKL